MVRQLSKRLSLKAYRWTGTEGLASFQPCDQPAQAVFKALELLSYIKTSADHCLFVLLDFHPFLQDAMHVRYLKDIALATKTLQHRLLVCHSLVLPEELRPFLAHFRLPLPTPEELREIVYRVTGEWGPSMATATCQPPTKPSNCWCQPRRLGRDGDR